MAPRKDEILDSLNENLSSLYRSTTHRWFYANDRHGEHGTTRGQTSKIAFIRLMRNEWRSERLQLPVSWIPEDSRVIPQRVSTNVYNISLITAPIRPVVDALTPSALAERYLQLDGYSPSPDFCLQTYKIETHVEPDDIQGIHIIKTAYAFEGQLASPCEATVAPLMTYTGGEHLASYVISGMFSGIPGCWLSLQTKYHLPASFKAPESQRDLDFSVLPYPQSSASAQNKIRDAELGITFMHPAVFIAMKGPRSWNSDEEQSPTNIDVIVRDLAAHARPNLDILHATWRIHHQHSSQCPPLPEWAIIFGIIYDAQHLHVVAHFLSDDLDYISVLVDTFDFPSTVDEESVDFTAWSETRTRMVMALLTVQKHVHRLASLWDDVHFPQGIMQDSSELDDFIMGPTFIVRTYPSDNGKMSEDSRYCLEYAPEDNNEDLPAGFQLSPDSELHKYIKKWLDAISMDEPADMPDAELQQPDSHFGLLEGIRVSQGIVNQWEVFNKARHIHRGITPRFRAYEIRQAIAGPYMALAIPEELSFSEYDTEISWDALTTLRYALEMYLKGVMDFALDTRLVEYSETSVIASLPRIYPDLDVNMNPKPQAFRLFLTHMSPISYERDVFNVMLETLPAFFRMPGCQVSHTFASHPGVVAPLPIAIQSRMTISGIPDSRSPTLLVALPWDARPLDEGQLMLTSYFEWTLNLLVANLPSPAANPEIPPWCVLYGLLYTARGIRIFAHYPEWNHSEARWRLVTETSTYGHHEKVFSLPHYGLITRLAMTLMSLRRHTWEVKVNLEAWLEQNGTDVLL